MRIKLTESFIEKVKYNPKGNNIYWDLHFPGFGLYIGKTNYKSFIIYTDITNNSPRKKIRKVIGRADILTIEEAKQRARGIIKAIKYNVNQETNIVKCPNLEKVYRDFIRTKEIRLNTRKMFETALNLVFQDWKDRPINCITKDMVENRFLTISSKTKSGANLYFRFLSSIFSFAIEKYDKVIETNPCSRLKALKMWNRIEPRKGKLYEEDFKPFLAELNDVEKEKNIKKLLMFLLFTGCRLKEGMNLKWDDIDFEHRIITFRNTKNHSTHRLPIGNWLKKNLKELEEETKKDNNVYVFIPQNKKNYEYMVRKKMKEINLITGLTIIPHDLRRTFSSITDHYIGKKYSHYIVKRLLNHTSSDVTANYVSVGIEDLREPMQEIENYILSKV